MTVEPEIIALDATARPRPGGQTLEELVMQIRARYPSVLLMADIATIDEAVTAERLGLTAWALRSTAIPLTLPGMCWRKTTAVFYVRYWRRSAYLSWQKKRRYPERAARCLELGAHTVVVGGAITRPQQITARFVAAIAS
jgi:N-acylglucosamine-6-phosphate 2-epimerase